MFTGIVEEIGAVESFVQKGAAGALSIRCATVLTDAYRGSSIAVNGVCLTAVSLSPGLFAADLAPETITRTNLGELRPGAPVNLERPMAASARFGGHMMQGHVDGVGEIVSLQEIGVGNWWLRIRVREELDRYFVEKGSIAIDGISLTVARVESYVVGVTIIPHTYANTNLSSRRPGDRVNLECDVIAKYVEKMLRPSED